MKRIIYGLCFVLTLLYPLGTHAQNYWTDKGVSVHSNHLPGVEFGYYTKGVAAKEPDAATMLAFCYLDEHGTPRNPQKAEQLIDAWCFKSETAANMAMIYYTPREVFDKLAGCKFGKAVYNDKQMRKGWKWDGYNECPYSYLYCRGLFLAMDTAKEYGRSYNINKAAKVAEHVIDKYKKNKEMYQMASAIIGYCYEKGAAGYRADVWKAIEAYLPVSCDRYYSYVDGRNGIHMEDNSRVPSFDLVVDLINKSDDEGGMEILERFKALLSEKGYSYEVKWIDQYCMDHKVIAARHQMVYSDADNNNYHLIPHFANVLNRFSKTEIESWDERFKDVPMSDATLKKAYGEASQELKKTLTERWIEEGKKDCYILNDYCQAGTPGSKKPVLNRGSEQWQAEYDSMREAVTRLKKFCAQCPSKEAVKTVKEEWHSLSRMYYLGEHVLWQDVQIMCDPADNSSLQDIKDGFLYRRERVEKELVEYMNWQPVDSPIITNVFDELERIRKVYPEYYPGFSSYNSPHTTLQSFIKVRSHFASGLSVINDVNEAKRLWQDDLYGLVSVQDKKRALDSIEARIAELYDEAAIEAADKLTKKSTKVEKQAVLAMPMSEECRAQVKKMTSGSYLRKKAKNNAEQAEEKTPATIQWVKGVWRDPSNPDIVLFLFENGTFSCTDCDEAVCPENGLYSLKGTILTLYATAYKKQILTKESSDRTKVLEVDTDAGTIGSFSKDTSSTAQKLFSEKRQLINTFVIR